MTTTTPKSEPEYDAALPLSARQGLMWVDDQLYPSARYHNLPIVIELAGALDVARFSRAWRDAVSAHDALRLGLSTLRPEQAPVRGEIPPLACERVAADEVTQYIAERCVQRLNHGGFMWDATLIETAADHHLFYICQDHILTDGMSQWVLFEDLAERYAGRTPAPVATFRDYLAHEAAYLASPKAHDDRAYWERKLGTGGTALRPYGIARRDRSVALDRVWHDAGAALGQRLNERAKEPAFTAWSAPLSRVVVLATATAAFLHRITENREIVLALPYANRTPRFARTYGLLMQQLFLRVEVREGDTFASLARTVKAELVQSIRHGQTCVSTRDLDAFTLNLLPRSPQRFGNLDARLHIEPAPVRGGAGAGQGDLRETLGLQVHDFEGGSVRLGFDCHAATFDAGVQARMRAQFVRVIEALASDADQAIDTLPLLDDAERRQVVRAARGREPAGAAPDIVTQIAEQARRRPGKVAVEGPGATFTYAELDAVSNRLARKLAALGVGRESRVGIALPRCSAELVALLATLKAGGAYVPVDPSHPEARVRLILEDAAPDVLIAPAQSPLFAGLPAATKPLALDDLAGATAGFDATPLDCAYEPDQLAYVLFTSGSTGRPKGVQITRGALANLMRSLAHRPGVSHSDRLLAITTTTFDIASLELFLPLCAGASCVIADRETALDPRRLRQALERGAFSLLQATPATWRMLVEAGWQGDGRLRMLTGGDVLSPELAQALLERGGELWNLYGPTETTVYSTGTRVERGAARIHIGQPIDHTQVYVLDPAQQLVPPGVVGELYIGGDGVARGYHGRADLTAQRFVPDPFAAGGGRLYRSGDLGRVLDDGCIECLGRVDHQVKIRGFRIELGEIESALRGTQGVQDVVVVASAAGSAEAKLVTYWTGSAGHDALLQRAREKLPQYMVPAAYVHMDAFPLTTSGKVDRKALPAPDATAPAAADLRLPGSELEQRIAAIWREVLGVSAIGVDQDFFALGGSSILVVAVRDRIERALGAQLPLRVFFDAPTIEGLARALEGSAQATPERSCLVRLKPSGGERCLFLIHDGDGEVLLYRNLALQMPEDVAVYGVVPCAERGVPMIHTRVDQMADHYVREIRARQPHGPYYLSGLCAGGVIAFEVARRLQLAGERVGLLALIDAVAPQARAIPLRIARARAQRFRRLIGELRVTGAFGVARETQRRLHNVARYELFAHGQRLRSRALVWLLAQRYAQAPRSWPRRLPAPSVRDVYMRALARYTGRPVDGIPTVLFRATEGAGDDLPVREVFEDPFFGWRELLGGSIRVIDAPGGHSTMLQQGRVDAIARHLCEALDRASADEIALSRKARATSVRAARTSITIVVVSYKTASLVTRLLASIARERARGTFALRTIVVDNASGDAPALRAAIARERWNDWVTLIEAERNGGFAYGNNVGFAHAYARGEVPDFFYLLNPDCEVRPGAIDALVQFMQAQPDAGIAGSSLEDAHGQSWPYAFRFPSLSSELEHALGISFASRLLARKVVAKRMEAAQPEEIDWMPGAAMIVRRNVIDHLGGMDESYFLYYEETDFCRKVKAAGFGVWYVPQSRVMHIAGQSTGVTAQRDQARRLPDYWYESRRRYFAKHHGTAYAMATDAVTLFAYALGRVKLALQRRNARAVPRYLYDLARHSPLRARNRALSPTREFRAAS